MSAFEFVFSLFSLLLGFSLVEVLGGLARAIEAQLRAARIGAGPEAKPFRAGWLTPLFGLFVMLDVISFWGSAWAVREQIDHVSAVMVGALLFAGAYYVAAHLVFPSEREDWDDLDAHYFRVRRAVFGALIVLTTLQIAYLATVPEIAAAFRSTVPLTGAVIHYALMIAAMLVRGKALGIAVLSLLSLRYLVMYLI